MRTPLTIIVLLIGFFFFLQETVPLPDTVNISFYKAPENALIAAQHDSIISSNIIGKWKDQNSTLIFKKGGKHTTIYDKGISIEGKWEISKRVLKLTFEGLFMESQDAYLILSFKKNKMEYRQVSGEKDPTIWIAQKISDKP